MREQPVKARYIVAVILGFVCIVVYGNSKGWFGSESRSPEVEATKVSISQPFDQESASKDAAPAAEVAKEPADSAAK